MCLLITSRNLWLLSAAATHLDEGLSLGILLTLKGEKYMIIFVRMRRQQHPQEKNS
jgi:hypothetical protein